MAKKVTIVEQYEAIIAKATEGKALSKEDVEFLIARKDLAAKKNANRKPTKQQEENEVYKTEILKGMEEGKRYTITNLIKTVPAISDLANQKVSALVRLMILDGVVKRVEEKGVAYFSRA